MADDEEWTTSRWWYTGQRYIEGKVYHQFLTETGGRPSYAKGPPGLLVGAVYEVESKDSLARVKSAKWLSKEPRHEDTDQWRLQDRAAMVLQESDRAERRLRKQTGNLGNLTLEEIRLQILRQPRHMKLGTILAVTEYLDRWT